MAIDIEAPGAHESDLKAALRALLPTRRALVEKTADQTGANYSTDTAVSWGAASHDTDSFWSAGAPTRLTVPAGVTSVMVGGTIVGANVTAGSDMRIRLKKNGLTQFDGACGSAIDASITTPEITIASGPIAVVATDYFELFYTNSDTSTDITATRSNFWIIVLA
jgi:hypothetical protein